MALKLKKRGPVQKPIKKNKPTKKINRAHLMKKNKPVNLPVGEYIEAVGRRKLASARVRLYPKDKSGQFIVNKQLAADYFANENFANFFLNQPLEVVGIKSLAVSAQVSGSGIQAQLGAVMHGLSRALIKFKPELRPLLKQAGLLTRDDRMKETRKIGRGGKARRKRQSPKR